MALKKKIVEVICDGCGTRAERFLTPPWREESIRRSPSDQQAGYGAMRQFCSEKCLNDFKKKTDEAWAEKREQEEEKLHQEFLEELRAVVKLVGDPETYQHDRVLVKAVLKDLYEMFREESGFLLNTTLWHNICVN